MPTSVERLHKELSEDRDDLSAQVGGMQRFLQMAIDDTTRAMLQEQITVHQTKIGLLEAAIAGISPLMAEDALEMPAGPPKDLHARLSKILEAHRQEMQSGVDSSVEELEAALEPFERSAKESPKETPKEPSKASEKDKA